jgi:hypothetical protein
MPSLMPVEAVIWHETGGWTIGWNDEAPAFPTRNFAEAVSVRQSRHQHHWMGHQT